MSCTADLYGGTVLAEALVQIEPSEFTPAWYAGQLVLLLKEYVQMFQLLHFYYKKHKHITPLTRYPLGLDITKNLTLLGASDPFRGIRPF